MSENQNNPVIHMNIDNYAMGENSSNVVNNYPSPPRPNENREEYNQATIPNFPNQVKEAITTIKKYLARQSSNHEVKITKNGISVNGTPLELNYEACKICKNQPISLTCSLYERKICLKCVVNHSKEIQCLRCKNAKKNKDKLASEFEDKIERRKGFLISLGSGI